MSEAAKGYAFFDHTADVGIRAQGRTLAELFIRMAQGLTELIAQESVLQPVQARAITLTADDAEALLLAWLTELLFWFSTDRFVAVAYEFDELSGTRLRGRVLGDRFDPAHHEQGREVKAITRHQLEVKQESHRWQAQVIVDI